jgi:ribonuclease Z
MDMNRSRFLIASAFAVGIAVGVFLVTYESPLISTTVAQESDGGARLVSPTEPREREYYTPNTESLAPDEMRVIACGTGMPTTRAAQAAACFLVELGNGDKFIFDIGSGSAERICTRTILVRWVNYSSEGR